MALLIVIDIITPKSMMTRVFVEFACYLIEIFKEQIFIKIF